MVTWATGDIGSAADLQRRALNLSRALGHRVCEAAALTELGRVNLATADLRAATEMLNDALALYRDLGLPSGVATVLGQLGQLHLAAGDIPAATRVLTESSAVHRSLGAQFHEAHVQIFLGEALAASGDLSAARRVLEQSVAWGLHRVPPLEARAKAELARIRHTAGDTSVAAAMLREAATVYRATNDQRGLALVHRYHGDLAADTGAVHDAVADYSSALGCARAADDLLGQAYASECLAHGLERIGDRASARARLREAVVLYRRIGSGRLETAAQAQLAAWCD
ncbi:tetratricopeptide (TPR) repeat protein [Streptacidiphilus sp. EB103A]